MALYWEAYDSILTNISASYIKDPSIKNIEAEIHALLAKSRLFGKFQAQVIQEGKRENLDHVFKDEMIGNYLPANAELILDKLDAVSDARNAWEMLCEDRLRVLVTKVICRPLCKYRDSYLIESNLLLNHVKIYNLNFPPVVSNVARASISSNAHFSLTKTLCPLFTCNDLFEAVVSIKSSNSVKQVANLACVQLELRFLFLFFFII